MKNKSAKVAETIIKLEKAALDRWGKGDPSGCLEISAHEVTYFDPFIEHRICGLAALTQYYDGLRGKIQVDRYELIDPKVELVGDAAILTFNYVSYNGADRSRWNCTEVYQNLDGQWKIIQTHWSLTQPKLAKT
ncbi:MAG: nuclear transport factor 2 family protein [Candidatus Ozemobacteraceae bacterium]